LTYTNKNNTNNTGKQKKGREVNSEKKKGNEYDVAPDPGRGLVTEYEPTDLEIKETEGLEETITKIHNHRKLCGKPWQFLYETNTKWISYGNAKPFYRDMRELGTMKMFKDYLDANHLTFEQLGIVQQTEVEEEKKMDEDDEEEEELMSCTTNHQDWKSYKEETLPSWCAPNCFYGGLSCATCDKKFTNKISEENKGKCHNRKEDAMIYNHILTVILILSFGKCRSTVPSDEK
jgi:hypothetical protein